MFVLRSEKSDGRWYGGWISSVTFGMKVSNRRENSDLQHKLYNNETIQRTVRCAAAASRWRASGAKHCGGRRCCRPRASVLPLRECQVGGGRSGAAHRQPNMSQSDSTQRQFSPIHESTSAEEMDESGVDLGFDLNNLDTDEFWDLESRLDEGMFYELRSKTVPYERYV